MVDGLLAFPSCRCANPPLSPVPPCQLLHAYTGTTQTFRWSGGISGLQVGEDETTITTIELDRAAGDTVGIYLSQGDGFDKQDGIFVSRVDMGSAAETMGLKVGHEVVAVNDVEVGDKDVLCEPRHGFL